MASNTEKALVEWVDTFPLETRIESLQELNDGYVLNEMLRTLDKQYFTEGLEKNTGPSKWLSKKQNLEAVYKSLLRYIRDHCKDFGSSTINDTPDFAAIAEHDDVQEITKFLTILLLAAISGIDAPNYIKDIQGLSTPSAIAMMEIITKMEDVNEQTSEADTHSWEQTKLPNTLTNDSELAAEEERAALAAEHTALKKRHADLMTRFEHLQDSHDELRNRHDETENELRTSRAESRGDLADIVKEMQDEIQRRDDLIANQESQIEDNRRVRERYEKELLTLRPAADRLHALADQVQELRTENATLSKKANMVDHFQKKLESQSGIEKDNSKLREQIDTYRDNQKFFDQTVQSNSKLQASIEEYQKRFHSYELEHVELSNQKKILEDEIRRRDIEINKLNEQKLHDERFIADLQETISTGGQQAYPSTPSASGRSPMTLEQELGESQESVNYTLEISRLKAENQLLKTGSGGTVSVDQLDAEAKYKNLEQKNNKLIEDYAISQQQLQAMISTSENDKNEAVINTRKLYLEANQERDTLKAKLQQQLATTDNGSLTNVAGLSTTTKTELEVLHDKIEKQNLALLELQRKLKAAEDNSADALKGINERLLRENAMLVTAWYDLRSRIQSNHVVIQRKQDAQPKSWLNQQRHLVNATPRR